LFDDVDYVQFVATATPAC